MGKMITAPMAARMIGVNRVYVNALIADGRLAATDVREGTGALRPLYLIDLDDVKAFAARRARERGDGRARTRKAEKVSGRRHNG